MSFTGKGKQTKTTVPHLWGFCASLSFSNELECTLIECNCYASVLLAMCFYLVLMILLGSAGFSIGPPSPIPDGGLCLQVILVRGGK